MPLDALEQAHLAIRNFLCLAQHLQQRWLNPIQGCYRFHFDETTLDLWFGDVAENLPQLGDYMNSKIDAWFLDGLRRVKTPTCGMSIFISKCFVLPSYKVPLRPSLRQVRLEKA